MITFSNFFFSLIVLLTISYLTGYFLKIFSGQKYGLVLFPGTVIHELSHLIACLLTGAKIKKTKIFSTKGGFIKHGKPLLPILGPAVISLFPVFGGIAVLYFIFEISQFNPPEFYSSIEFLEELKVFFAENYNLWQFWALIYLIISIVVCIIPSKKDLENSALSLLFIFSIVFILFHFNVLTDQIELVFERLMDVLIYGTVLGSIGLVVSFCLYLFKIILVKFLHIFS